jgi:hypothetical protein
MTESKGGKICWLTTNIEGVKRQKNFVGSGKRVTVSILIGNSQRARSKGRRSIDCLEFDSPTLLANN